ncbi:hypothetical protein C3747_42g168 [Trypanosoma cruzi]|uniref:AAA+ ATPase domain-containing protein n=2 Tax=Trypanosoma cruzi TaxID=5693 RepID=Q4CQ82_TRYCC|nr:hypothetical protein, conserved [Trypanosoma cruzi]EAN82433.1 hypothetical protein, conserved [Trypanosoma cruzi]PWV13651.1 hypothetical protein C3747_42g168 [Trypanosoma cruzi]RNC44744.1 hypothetical protein TcCL_NonESM05493 [Trypanosoma cruzi]|eukprot:XP_804284.1 hypothetical protein [Trypanosoma cruzi strain CL Brener]
MGPCTRSVCGLALLVFFVAALSSRVAYIELDLGEADDCSPRPLCSSHPTLVKRLLCFFFCYPVNVDGSDYKKHVLDRLRRLTQRNLKGQPHVVEGVIRSIAAKLENPDKPLVLHFAGDNGVGKTTLAQIISLSLGLRCHDTACETGDSTLVLSGVSYDGYSVQEFRRVVIPKVVQHIIRFPKNGVIIINDLGALHPDLVRVLLPLLGRATSFPEAPGVFLSRLFVIVTTDFGRQGRTQGKSLTEMRRIVEDDFKGLYSQLSSSMIETFPFLSAALDTAKEIVWLTIMNYKCRHREAIRELLVSEDAILWLVDFVRDDLPMENGRCVANAVSALVGPGILRHLLENPSTPVTLRVDINDNGSVTVLPVRTD